MITLYDYFRSTASYRVRLALTIKNIPYEKVEIHLTNNGGEHHSPEYLDINPQGLVPCLDINGQTLNQSLAIIEYLDETYPDIPLLPQNPFAKATIRSLAFLIACDIHPLNNLRVLNRLKEEFKADDSHILSWYHHWLKSGFDAFEKKLSSLDRSAPFCLGNQVTMADICLIPQVFNAKRFNFLMNDYPLINQINDHCLQLEAFKKASPDSKYPSSQST